MENLSVARWCAPFVPNVLFRSISSISQGMDGSLTASPGLKEQYFKVCKTSFATDKENLNEEKINIWGKDGMVLNI